MLIGRERERHAIEELLARARVGEAGCLLLRGEPGAGKSALLAGAVGSAGDMTVVRATGVESEAELEFSGLLEVCRPLLHLLGTLAGRQADALRVALGVAAGRAPDRFEVGAATLSLLAAAAEEAPLLVVVDDAQWVDRASLDALLFAGRRLLADRVAVLLAAREGFDVTGVEELLLGGLEREAAEQLVEQAVGRRVPATVAAALWEATGGNPLALIELPRRLEPARLAGDVPLVGLLPVTEELERAFAGRLAVLPERTCRAIGVVATGTDELEPSLHALGALGLGPDDLAAAEDAGVVAIDGDRIRFAHPLLRSVAYHALPPSERRAAHAALAAALTAPGDVERRAWHLASAAVGPDEHAAAGLVAAADAARARGGHEAAAAALERAARLTTGPAERRDRLLAAAQAAWESGDAVRASSLVDEVLAGETDPAARARALGLAGRIEFQAGSLERARALLLEASATLVELGDRTHAVTLLGVTALILHNLAHVEEAIDLARRAIEVASTEPEDVRMRATYHLGRALQIAGRTDEAEPLLDTVIEHLLAPPAPSRFALQRAAIAAAVLTRPAVAAPLARRTLEAAQASGPMQVAYALSLVSQIQMHGGEWRAADGSAAEGVALARAMGQENVAATFASFLVRIAGARGDRGAFERWEPVARAAVEASGNRFERLQLDHAAAQLALAEDRLDLAAGQLVELAPEVASLGVLDRDLAPEPDLVEVLVRLGRDDEARDWLDRWIARGAGRARAWGPPLVARCRALLAEDDGDADALFVHALAGGEAIEDPAMTARTRLLLGERLRRRGRRVDARRELGAAVAAFEQIDAEAWAERGRRELRASGARLRRAADAGDELTPQELQIASQVAEGKANKEVAAALFLSPKTVEFHLSRVYRKLGVSSRAELVRRFAATGAGAPTHP